MLLSSLMIQTVTAINIKSIPYSESSAIVHVFSKEYGKLSLMAKGIKKSKTGNQGKLSTFFLNKYHIRSSSKSSIKTITCIENLEIFEGLSKDYDKLKNAYEVLWLVNSVIQEDHPAPRLFTETLKALKIIEHTHESEHTETVNKFKKMILEHEGVLNTQAKTISIDMALEKYIGKQIIKL